MAYAPYGAAYADDPVAGTDRLFAGQDVLTAPDLYDSQSRRYSPIATRWLSPDPAGMSAADPENPQSWNRYAYAGGKPLTQIDPGGKDEIAVDFTR